MPAVISQDEKYRYLLTRSLEDAFTPSGSYPLPFLMLNPSTADADVDDNTIRRCKKFAQRDGYSGIVVANLYALRSTDPENLWRHEDPIGPENELYLEEMAIMYPAVVCAWGADAPPARVLQVIEIFQRMQVTLLCLSTTKSGAPRHPLYVKGDQQLITWDIEKWKIQQG